MAKTHRFFMSGPRRLEALLHKEAKQFGAIKVKESPTGVYVMAPISFAYRASMWSRVANSILLNIGTGQAHDTDSLYQSARDVAWEDHFDVHSSFVVSCTLGRTSIDHDHFATLRVKDGIVDRFKEKFGARPNVDRYDPDMYIRVHIDRDEVLFYLELSGPSLHQRGYRDKTVEAPLKENVAAAMLLRAGWPAIAQKGGAFYDPMCGSGTLAIEAAMMAGDYAPGMTRRRFGFERWNHFDEDIWRSIRDEARQRSRDGEANIPTILASDIDHVAVSATRINAMNAGLENLRVHRADIAEISAPEPFGLFVANPPYGERLGDDVQALATHKVMGETMKREFIGWNAAILTMNQTLGHALGFRAKKAQQLDNGKLDCLLLLFELREDRVYKGYGQ